MGGEHDEKLIFQVDYMPEMLIRFILRFGAPREIRVSNEFVKASLTQICDICEISLRKVKRLPEVEEAMEGMRRLGI